jgi:outer membrane protein insertion porin family
VVADIGISERNFRGRGQQLTFRISAGSLRQEVNLGFTEPRFMGRNLAAGVNLYTYRYDFSTEASYETSSTGISTSLGFPLTDTSRLVLVYALHADQVNVDNSFCLPGAQTVSHTLCDQRGATLTSSVGYQYHLDKRDDPIKPTRGFSFDFSQDFAGLGGTVKYVSTKATFDFYHGFSPAFVLNLHGDVGDVEAWGNDYVRINDRFFKGGQTFRGFQTAGVGPRDTVFNDSLGGNVYGIGTVEMTFPTGLPEQYGINAAMFTDFGTVGTIDKRAKIDSNTGLIDPDIADNLALRASAGISIFWKSPMGPLRFDIADVLARQSYDKTENFQFSTSTRF